MLSDVKTATVPSQQFSFVSRETGPLGSGQRNVWVSQKPDIWTLLQNSLSEWLADITVKQEMFKRFVYENEDLHDTDLRQHRLFLFELLCHGEALALDYMMHAEAGPKEAIEATMRLIEERKKELFRVLLEWHGPPDIQTDLPDSFKQAMREVEEGKIVDFKEPEEAV
jgi:hypothetical protein